MKRQLSALVLSALGLAASAHEIDFPLLAIGGPANTVEANLSRPQQASGQTLPLRPTRQIKFDTDEGTWLSVDLAPDGKRLVFDLLGDLYTLDAAGGRATAITRGLSFDTQPTHSPDGQWLAFVSDRSGAENVWLAKPNGAEPGNFPQAWTHLALISAAYALNNAIDTHQPPTPH